MVHNEFDKDNEPIISEYGCAFSIGGAITVVIIAILMSAIMTSCKTKYIEVERTITEEIIQRDTIVEIELIPYKDSVSVQSDSSYLSNPYSYSYAKWDNGVLSHSLGVFPNTIIPYKVMWLDKYVTIKEPISYPVDKIIKVEKKLSWAQRARMRMGDISLIALFVYLFIKGLKKRLKV